MREHSAMLLETPETDTPDAVLQTEMPPMNDPGQGEPPLQDPTPPESPEYDPDPGEPPLQDPPEPEPDEPDEPDTSIKEPPDQETDGYSVQARLPLLERPANAEEASGNQDATLQAMLEAVIYVTEEPLSSEQLARALNEPLQRVERLLAGLQQEYSQPQHGLIIREVAGGYKMTTKPEHHEAIRTFVKNLKPPLKLSMAALETLAVIAYKQPVTGPEILDIRGVQGGSVLKTLLDRKLITTAGRKNVVGKPMQYKTTKEFLLQFGLRDLDELPTPKEFEELSRLALTDEAESTEPRAQQAVAQ